YLREAQRKLIENELFFSPGDKAKYHVIDVAPSKIRVERLDVNPKTSEAITFAAFSKFIDIINSNNGQIKRTVIGKRHSYSSLKQSAIVNFLTVLDWDESTHYIISVPNFSVNPIEEAGEDLNSRILRYSRVRQGQMKLKVNLLRIYNGECCISRCSTAEVLQAAHIIPYAESRDNNTFNALLLRSDIHDLFDCHLIGINPHTLRIHLHPRLINSKEYGHLKDEPIKERQFNTQINYTGLEQRWMLFQQRLMKSL
ncbi:MAG: HNH endonuclease, partial [Flavisolibacter sp.]